MLCSRLNCAVQFCPNKTYQCSRLNEIVLGHLLIFDVIWWINVTQSFFYNWNDKINCNCLFLLIIWQVKLACSLFSRLLTLDSSWMTLFICLIASMFLKRSQERESLWTLEGVRQKGLHFKGWFLWTVSPVTYVNAALLFDRHIL